ncbi:MAG: hypothetical protein ABIF09_18485, partial [Gemmatimonadota bacterium]
MAEERSHKTTANRIAQKYGAQYNNGEGVDIRSPRATVEVETPDTVAEASSQLRGHRGPVYIAGTNKGAVEKALETTKGTTIGVMDN